MLRTTRLDARARTARTAVALTAALALLATACGDDAADDAASAQQPAEEPTDVASTEDEGHGEDESFEGEVADPDALFGVAVCDALRPVVLGEPDEAVERYARPHVLDLLAPLEDQEFLPDAEDLGTSEGADGQSCLLDAGGDAWWELTLAGDGHVGQTAVGAVLRTSYDSADPSEDITAALEQMAGSDAEAMRLCDGREPLGHELLVTQGNHVVFAQCDMFAYQGEYQPLLWTGYDLRFLPVEVWAPGPDGEGELLEGTYVYGFPTTDGFGIENLEKGRGIGDCGTFSVWSIGDDLSLDLDLATHRECSDEEGPVDPYEWEQVYAAEA